MSHLNGVYPPSEASPLMVLAADAPTTGIDVENPASTPLEILGNCASKTNGIVTVEQCCEHDDSPINRPSIDDDIHESISSWVRLVLFFGACVLSGGIMPGQNVYSRLFCEAGVFAYACGNSNHDGGEDTSIGSINATNDPSLDEQEDICCPAQWLLLANVMNALSSTMAFFFLLGGLLFDMIGGRHTAVFGCVMNAAGFAILALLIGMLTADTTNGDGASISPVVETAIFIMGVLLVDIGSAMSNISFYGFLWHLPKQQALILSLSNCLFNVAAFIPLALRALLNSSQIGGIENYLNLPSVLAMYASVIALIASPISWFAVPSSKEYRSRAMEVLKLPIPARKVKGMKGVKDTIEKAFRILQHQTQLHCVTIIVCTLAWIAPFIYMTMADPMAQEIFGDKASGERLATLYNVCNGYLGLFLGPILGVIVDRFRRAQDGVEMLGYCIVVTVSIIAVLCPIPSWRIQLINVSSSASCMITTMLFITRYAVIFAPPDRVGTVSGLLVAGLGVLAFIPIIAMSIDISTNGSYIQPQQWICIVGAIAWVAYMVYIKKTSPWPSSPVLLPEDESDIAKMYGVGTIEDAAYVSGKSVQVFRRLSSSSNVLDQRALLDAAFTGVAAAKIMKVARRRSSCAPIETVDEIPRYPIVDNSSSRNGVRGNIRRGTAATSIDCIHIAFNGHGGFGGRAEQSIQWICEPLGEPDTPARIAAMRAVFAPMVECAERYGTILEVRVMDEDTGNEVTAASCTAFHPGSLEDNGATMKTGSDRYYFSLAASNECPVYMDREIYGEKMMQRFVGMKQDSAWDEKRKDYMSIKAIWYIGILGTHPQHQGKGAARRLLDIVAEWASRDNADCYLECSQDIVPFYEKCGYKTIWRSDIVVDGTGTVLFGMVLVTS